MISPSKQLDSRISGDSFGIRSADVLIVGSGVAGLSTALEFSRIARDSHVILLTRDTIGGHGASPLAQGGIAAALDPSDSPSLHAMDTELAANGLGQRDLIDILTTDGPARVRELMNLGARFDLDPWGEVSLGLEGAHSRRRIIHAHGDRTGAEVTRTLREAVRHCRSIKIVERTQAVELFVFDGQVRGLWARKANGTLHLYRSKATILATGGPGRVYLRTTAPPGLDGDGMTMAARAGAKLRDAEFVQFHPTALNVQTDPLPLVTEALRGAGARLVNRAGDRLLGGSEGDDDLASRDRVARALWLKAREGDQVFLDARRVFGPRIDECFPGVHQLCRIHGINPALELIPVTPAAHYHMGGVAVDREGQTSLSGLWVVGEAAASGVHGANRLASNSLLEGLVFGPRAARSIVETTAALPEPSARERGEALVVAQKAYRGVPIPESVVLRIRTLLWDLVGVVRTKKGLATAVDQLETIDKQLPPNIPGSSRTLLLSARVIAQAALLRKESVGSHYRSDAPHSKGASLQHSTVTVSLRDPHRLVAEFEDEQPGGELMAGSASVQTRAHRKSTPAITV